ncbi:claudin-4-like [Clinocottus analis]|uniref:claudin-4-like n=1 Tax=Clinocottus analis TaxID=304258 RepID=UPI0035C09DA0
MYSAGLEILGMILAVAGWLGVMVTCGLPMWRVAAYIGQNIVISQVIWEGLWMNCSVQSTGQMHCRVHDSMLGLPVDLQAARALVIVSMVLCVGAIGLSVAGAKCTNCSRDVSSKPRLVVASGVTFAVAGLLLLVAVSWTAHAIVLGFYDPLLQETGKREFGNALSDMPSVGLEILGVTLAVLGWISAIASCALPMWRVSAFIGVNIVTAQTIWEGIWMNCVVQSTGQMQCKIHDSMLALSADLQAARALTIISILVGIVGVMVAMMGAKCTNCVDEESAKARVMIAAGAAFILASVTQLIPVSWSAHTIIMEFYNPNIPETQKREIGAALYLGWAAASFLLIGGGILCSSCPTQPEKRYGPPSKMMYSQKTQSLAPGGYDRKDYV